MFWWNVYLLLAQMCAFHVFPLILIEVYTRRYNVLYMGINYHSLWLTTTLSSTECSNLLGQMLACRLHLCAKGVPFQENETHVLVPNVSSCCELGLSNKLMYWTWWGQMILLAYNYTNQEFVLKYTDRKIRLSVPVAACLLVLFIHFLYFHIETKAHMIALLLVIHLCYGLVKLI